MSDHLTNDTDEKGHLRTNLPCVYIRHSLIFGG